MYTDQVTVTTSRDELHPGGSVPRIALVKNPAGGSSVFIGGPAVTTLTGFELAAGESIRVPVGTTGLHGITSSGTQLIYVIEG